MVVFRRLIATATIGYIEGDFFPGETDEVTAAHLLAHACDQLGQILDDYRRRVLVRLARERRADPF